MRKTPHFCAVQKIAKGMGLLLAGASLFIPQGAEAKPAKQGIIMCELPDGTELPTRLVGDEFAHRTLSEDGYVLVYDADGYLNYGVFDGTQIVSSGRRAVAVANRTAQDIAFLNTIDKDGLLQQASNLDVKHAEMRRSRMASPRYNNPQKANTSQGIDLLFTEYPSKGSPKALVILVEFQDKAFSVENPHEYFEKQLNEKGYSVNGATGSALDFFTENSNGQFTPQFDLYGPVKVSKNMSYYGGNDAYGNDKAPEEMVSEACTLLDAEVDFSQYDTDGDGFVDNVYVYYAGYGEADGGGNNTVWPHSYNLTYAGINCKLDGVTVDRYACSNEVDRTARRPDGIGTFVHEFSHVMGLPDLYDTVYSYQCFTPGSWSTLDYGPYNNNGRTPPNYGVYERYSLGWLEPLRFSGTGSRERILEPITSNQAYLIPTTNRNEFMLVEMRKQEGWDKYIPNSGMLVWRINYSRTKWRNNTVNNTATNQGVDIIEADNKQDEYNRPGDCFPGSANVTSFTLTTVPSFSTRVGGKSMGVEFPNISIDEDGNLHLLVTSTLEGEIEQGYENQFVMEEHPLYLVGANYGNWSLDENYQFAQDNNVYTLTLSEGISGEWKIWDGTWEFNFGGNSQPAVVGNNEAWFDGANFNFTSTDEVTLRLIVAEGSAVKGSSIPSVLEISTKSGIADVAAEATFSYELNGRTLSVVSEDMVRVYDIAGRTVATISNGIAELPAAGVYLITDGTYTCKLLVK